MRALVISDIHFGAWTGTAVLIDEDEPQPRLLELLADLNPRNGGDGLPPLPS